ncbi:MAG: hypothetical protein KDB80_06110 [Planctomycetes bacterium]|nr:hypothetical protein [Planctomycetota bacterium]
MRTITTGISLLLVAATASAQQGASTLASLCTRADAVLRVRVLASDPHDPATVRTVLQRLETLKGDAGERVFELTEPGGRACGRALQGLLPGAGYVVFLRNDSTRGRVLVGGGSRAVVSAEPEVVAHVTALCTVGASRLEILTSGLDSTSERVRRDAALALPTLTELPSATGPQRDRIRAEVRAALGRQDRTTIGLLTAASRLGMSELVPELVDDLVDGSHASFAAATERAVLRLDPETAGARLAARFESSNASARRRIVGMLTRLPAADARPGLRSVLACGDAACRSAAGSAWLRFGLDEDELRETVGLAEFEAYSRRLVTPPTFRSLRLAPRR